MRSLWPALASYATKSASSVMGRERQAAKQAAYTVADMVEDYIRE